jgi:hypothetical protein
MTYPECGHVIDGPAFNGRCYPCHNASLVPYESGDDYIGQEG